MIDDLILKQFAKEFKRMIEEILLREREEYLKENKNVTRANGYYMRKPKTIMGEIELNIPRTRDGKFKPSVLPERKRITFMLDDVIRAMFIAGVSSRRTGEVIRNLMGTSISHSYASYSSLSDISEEVINEFKERKLKEEYPVLYIDATYIPLKRDSVEKEAVYAVLGLRYDGKREILSYFLPGGDEKSSVWKDVFNDLMKRGLKGVKMIVSDDLKGLLEAIREVFPNVEHQLCWFHLKKNIKNRVRKRHWNMILDELNDIMESKDEKEGKEKLYAFIEKWKRLYVFIKALEYKVNNYTPFLRFPNKVRSYLRTTNWMERCFKELKDYIRIRGYFKSEESAEKFLYLFFKEKDTKYMSRRLRYADTLRESLERF